jgi:hypothetical protein
MGDPVLHSLARAALGAAALGLALALPAEGRAAEERDVFARVVVSETELRAGPGVSYRVIHRAVRGETFLVETRETKGFWLEVLLPDGRTAYVLGDTVSAISAEEDPESGFSKPGIFAPPALQTARGGFALMAGIYDGDGYSEVRPALVIAPAIAFEPYLGIALQLDSRKLLYGAVGTLNLAPDWAIAPFFEIGGGGVLEDPKDEFVGSERRWFHARAGGGLLVSLRLRLLFRLEASNVILFSEDDYENTQSYLAGLGTYF